MKMVKGTLFVLGVFLFLSACKNKQEYDASGTFETTEVIVSAQATGELMKFDVEEGSLLEARQIVGYIDTTQLYLKKLQLIANLNTTGSRYLNVNTQIASLEEQIDKQRTEQRRYENLVRADAANQKQLDDINSQLLVLQRQLNAQRESLQNNNEGVSGERSSLEVQIAQIEDQIVKSRISSPITGTVLSKYAEPGEITAQGRALFKVADINEMFLRAYITSDQLSQMQIGQEIRVFADFGKKEMREYSGVITWISDKAEFTPKTIQTRNERDNLVYAVKIRVTNDGYLKKGMYGEIKRVAQKSFVPPSSS